MILLALLVGSDYTTGIQGVGPVTALEILATFPPSKTKEINLLTGDDLIAGLRDFRNWLKSGRSVGPGRTALKGKLKNVNLFEGFPSVNVVRAYTDPTVETSKEHFSWAKPDIVGLIDFAKEKFGWTQKKSEEILKPVMKRIDEANSASQKSIKDFFKTKHKLTAALDENKLSKRVKTALSKMTTNPPAADAERTKKIAKTLKKTAPAAAVDDPNVEDDEDIKVLKAATELSKKKMGAFKAEIKERLSTVGVVASTSGGDGETTKRVRKTSELHRKDVVPQKERDKKDALKNKMRAIETFRKSKQGPGYVKKKSKVVRQPKDEAELSESSSNSN